MARIPFMVVAALLAVAAAGCTETLEPETPQAQQQSGGQLPLDLTPKSGNSALGGAIRAAESTEDKIAEHQERLNRQMDEE